MSNDEAHRRAGGRRRYNAHRQFVAMHRRRQVAHWMLLGMKQVAIAAKLGVHPSTISRDVASLNDRVSMMHECPFCGHKLAPRWLLEHYWEQDQPEREALLALGAP